MKDNDKEEIVKMMAEAIVSHKKEKSWFMKLGWFYKAVLGLSALVLSFSTIVNGVSYALDVINHKEIERTNSDRALLYNLVKIDSSIIYKIDLNSLVLDTLKRKGIEGNKFYAVGYRAEKKDDGTILRHYRDWNGVLYPIFPDPAYSTHNYTYWFYNLQDGTKEYTFGK